MSNLANTEQNSNNTDLLLTLPKSADRRFLHQQPHRNGLGAASKFADQLHIVAPELYSRRWS